MDSLVYKTEVDSERKQIKIDNPTKSSQRKKKLLIMHRFDKTLKEELDMVNIID